MFPVDSLILVGAVLVLFAIVSSKFSARFGVPLLVVFIAVGMLAGSEGVGGIAFENYTLAHGIGTVALALILFDGGLRTSMGALRSAWKPALTLATGGVLLTALITGAAAALILDIPLVYGILLGSIVGSTDAAAVFSVLRSKGARLPARLGSTLEIESGSNDPAAIFLAVGILEVVTGGMDPGLDLVWFFLLQMGVGTVAGLLAGRLGVEANNRINLAAAGLYPVMMTAVGFLAFGLAAALGGSGFLAVYIAGIVLGNRPIVFKRGIFLFNDGMAWLAQIVMFTMLGLLTFPSRLIDVAPAGLAIAGVLVFIARPLAVIPLALPFGFNIREITLMSWVGLRGAVPIVLGIFPLLYGLDSGPVVFDIVFFVVLVSATIQAWTLPWVADRLGLQEPARAEAPVTLEITSLRHVEADIIEYDVAKGSRAAGRLVRDLALPDGAVVAMIARGQGIIPPRGSTRLEPGDHAFLMIRSDVRDLVDRVFGRGGTDPQPLSAVRFPLSPHTRVADLVDFYGIEVVDAEPDDTLEDLLRSRSEGSVEVGSSIELGNVRIRVRDMSEGRIELVELQVLV